jgi:hypothetical protein
LPAAPGSEQTGARPAPTGRDDGGEPDRADGAAREDRVPRNRPLANRHDSRNTFLAGRAKKTGVLDIRTVAMSGLIMAGNGGGSSRVS